VRELCDDEPQVVKPACYGRLGSMDRKLVGSAGEHLVCSVLAQFNWAAALTREGVARTDVLAVNAETGRTISVQVKTRWVRAGLRCNFPLGLKDIVPSTSPTEWYVMVKLEGSAPAGARFFVVPRDHVAAAAWITHQSWMTDPTVLPGTRNAPQNQARVWETVWLDYESRWDLLDGPTDSVPVLLPSSLRADQRRVGLPPDHPWIQKVPKTGNWS
jgi:hypothetical protein